MVVDKKFYLFSVMFLAIGCSGASSPHVAASDANGVQETPTHPTPAIDGGLSICSKLDFANVDWPTSVSLGEHDPFALALNISGSFEGDVGWQNLTNDFDGQGLSLGLLNQCLGQGSLQPLMLQMRDQYNAEMKAQFSAANFDSVLAMLKQWESTLTTTSDEIQLSDYGLSKLDDPQVIESVIGFNPNNELHAELTSKNQNSVNWAVANLYNKTVFKPDWGTQLTNLSASQGYRSVQVAAALKLHTSTLTLFKTFGFRLYRSYLFLFDIEVQNGGISDVAMTNIFAAFKANPNWTEVQKLSAILTERLKYVKKEYVKDVQERKQSIITGSGTVHSVKRDYAKEYCADLNHLMP